MFGSPQERLTQAQARVGHMLREKYRIERVLGVGGMAAVYEATHRNGRRVAVKVLHTAASLNADMRKRFLREGHAANAVNHPGAVVVVDDDVTEDGAAFLVMELLEGEVVERIWQRAGERLPMAVTLALGYELCAILDAAHQAGIIHRDIKPENLFLTRPGQLKVLDFGLAQLRDHPKLTAIGMVFGTPAFMAPEQASGRASQVDARTDVWSVGATLFTLLSGQTVHQAETVQDLLVRAARKPARSLATAMSNVDPRLVHVVDRALSIEKNARWPSAAAMRKAIGETSLALFGDASPKLPSADALFMLPTASTRPTVDQSRPRHPSDQAGKFSIVDLSSSSDDHGDAATESDRKATRPSDAPTDPHTRPASASQPFVVEPGWNALQDEIESGRALGTAAATLSEPRPPEPHDAFFAAETLRRQVDSTLQWAPVGPPTPPGHWGSAAPPPSDPGFRPSAHGRPPSVAVITAGRSSTDPFAAVRRIVDELGRPGGVGRVVREHPEVVLVLSVGVAIVLSLIVVLAFAKRFAPRPASPTTLSAPAASSRGPRP